MCTGADGIGAGGRTTFPTGGADVIGVRSRLAVLGVGLMAGLGASSAVAAPVPGDLIVADAQAFGTSSCGQHCGGLITVDRATGAETVLSSNLMPVNVGSQFMGAPYTLVMNAAGKIIVGETEGLGGSCQGGCGGIVEVDPSTGKQTLISSNAMPINAASARGPGKRPCGNPAVVASKTSPRTRAGCRSATSCAIIPPIEMPTTNALSAPAASITSTVSSAIVAIVNGRRGRALRPTPRLSSAIAR